METDEARAATFEAIEGEARARPAVAAARPARGAARTEVDPFALRLPNAR